MNAPGKKFLAPLYGSSLKAQKSILTKRGSVNLGAAQTIAPPLLPLPVIFLQGVIKMQGTSNYSELSQKKIYSKKNQTPRISFVSLVSKALSFEYDLGSLLMAYSSNQKQAILSLSIYERSPNDFACPSQLMPSSQVEPLQLFQQTKPLIQGSRIPGLKPLWSLMQFKRFLFSLTFQAKLFKTSQFESIGD
ncbi:hypothetical protein TTHERM_001321602 (macronuclear) [Tetrahymena thermophila SB210]|uniref:Uncharacterized protein n=1 Tax=Tetrahymena thermophila (strain SB210) TaxID=312017 RepID=W7X836_TETTS|nr:hypothetical protein TTHERM_001321602 [Tetrahymena thermophila SB210]EWS75530.1 hypothetical protein TTHERM_001321602 [Tetrahymena thermophila SB210]|eukprot:XP_012651937.1 hypothetical protein TTHERM_001321602 [Tetrahymena thermophila SB210]